MSAPATQAVVDKQTAAGTARVADMAPAVDTVSLDKAPRADREQVADKLPVVVDRANQQALEDKP